MTLSEFIFGKTSFNQSEELLEFRYKFLIVLMLSGALFTLAFVVGEFTQINRIQTLHFYSMHLFSVGALSLWVTLRGRKHLFVWIAWIYETLCLLEYTSALWFVPADELRILWFFVNVPGVFIMLGAVSGWVITALTIVGLFVSNALMPSPYSSNAMATTCISMLYLGVFFHAYGLRSISYFVRMQDSNKTLKELATHDALTGVLNARAYHAVCDKSILQARRTQSPFSVLFTDLDHFKRVNDTYGHDAGDSVLKSVCTCIQTTIRQSDALGRIGGEEFSVFLPNTDNRGALQTAESIRRAIETLEIAIPGRVLTVTASLGVASCESEYLSLEAIQKNADEAMYQAKAQGRNRVSNFN